MVVEKVELEGFTEDLPEQLNLAVVMEKKPSSHPWADFRFDALGVVVREAGEEKSVSRVYQDGETEHFLVTGLSLRLYVDECEGYYHNLMSPEPGCFIVADQPDSSDDSRCTSDNWREVPPCSSERPPQPSFHCCQLSVSAKAPCPRII